MNDTHNKHIVFVLSVLLQPNYLTMAIVPPFILIKGHQVLAADIAAALASFIA